MLNRSHRERKERYIRNLEQEVQRLREAYTISVKEKTAVMDENRQLHVLLKENGIIFPHPVQAQALLSIENEGVTGATGNLAQLQLHSHNEHYEHPQSSISPPQIGLNHSPGQQLSSEQYSRIAIDLVLAYVLTNLYEYISRMTIINIIRKLVWKSAARIICRNSPPYPRTTQTISKDMFL